MWLSAQGTQIVYIPESVVPPKAANPEEYEGFKQWLFVDQHLFTPQKSTPDNPILTEELRQSYQIDQAETFGMPYDSVWYAEALNLPNAHKVAVQDSNVLVAIIDTGIFFEHQSLLSSQVEFQNSEKRFWLGEYAPFGYDFVYNRGITQLSSDWNGHGTAMASLIAGRNNPFVQMIGISPQAKLLAVRAFDTQGLASSLEIARAIVYAVEMGADVINMSFGDSYKSLLVETAVRYAASKNVLMVASAGNVGGARPRYPAAFEEVIAVSWLTRNFRIAPTGNYGAHISFAAPGSSVKHAAFTGDGNPFAYRSSSGSSASAAIVSGILAWYKSIYPDWSNTELLSYLKTKVYDTEQEGQDIYTGAGMPRLHIPEMDTPKAYHLALEIEELKTDSMILHIEVLGSSIKQWRLEVSRGFQLDDAVEVLLQPSNSMIQSRISVPFRAEAYTNSGFTLSVWADLWDGSSQRKSVYQAPGNATIEHELLISNWSINGEQVNGFNLWRSNEYGSVTQKLFNENNEELYRSSSTREGIFHVLQSPALQFAQAKNAVLSQFAWGNHQETRVELSDLSIPPRVEKDNTITRNKLNYIAFDVFSLPVGLPSSDSLWYFFQSREFGSAFKMQISRQPNLLLANKIASLDARFIPTSIYVNESTNQVALLGGYGGGRAYLFDVTNNFEPIQTEFLEKFVNIGLIADTDNDQQAEIWAHNREKWAVFEWNGVNFQKKTEFENPTQETNELFSNDFQIPSIALVPSSGLLKNLVFGDYDGDLFLVKTSGNDAWNLNVIQEGIFYGTGNAVQSIAWNGKPAVITYRHSFPGLDEQRTQQEEWIQIEFWDASYDSLKLVQSLVFTGIDFSELELLPVKDSNLYLAASPFIYSINYAQPELLVKPLVEERLFISPFRLSNTIGYYSIKDTSWLQINTIENPTNNPELLQITRYKLLSPSLEYVTIQSKNVDSVLIANNFGTVNGAKVTSEFTTLVFPALGSEQQRLYSLQVFGNNGSEISKDTTLSYGAYSFAKVSAINKDLVTILFESEPNWNTITQESLAPLEIQFFYKTGLWSFVAHTSRSHEFILNDTSIFLPIYTKTGYPYLFYKSTEPGHSSSTAFISKAEILGENQLQVEIKGFSENYDDIDFSFDQSIYLDQVIWKLQTVERSVAELRVSGVNLLNWGNPITLRLNWVGSGSPWNPNGKEISISPIPFSQDDFTVDDAISFPNPWVIKKQETVRFSRLPERSKILILNTAGSPIVELETQGLLRHFDWNGKDKQGNKVGSGVYFYQIIQGEKRSKIKKLAIIR